MSVVIIGGNDRMKRRYQEACESYGHKAKVFTQLEASMARKIGQPDLIILFTGTVSHKMVLSAISEAKRCNAHVARSHSSSLHALHDILAAC